LAYFDHFAQGQPTRLGDWLTRRTIARQYRFVIRYLTSNTSLRILEIGPGHGEFAAEFLQRGYRNYDVVEPNPTMRAKIQALGVRNARDYLIPDLMEEDNSFDLIIICDVFEHLNDTREAKRFISESMRVLAPGGLLFLLSPDLMDWCEHFYNCDFSHSNPTTVRRTLEMFQNEGLEPLEFAYLYSCFGGIYGYLLNRLVKFMTFWSMGESTNFKLYKLRLTFLRRFMVIGRKPG
jgi:SAM-dependent methyltransferase